MKTSTTSLLAALVFIGVNLSAQPRYGGNDPRQGNNQGQNQNTASASGNSSNDSKRGGHVNISINGGGYYGGGYYGGGYYGNGPYYSNYNNYYGSSYYGGYNMKRAARNSIHQSAGFIGQALQFTEWNDLYSPWLAKAIRHQQYARQLYFWGDYAGALNHAERAGFLAWNTLSYFNGGGYGYNNYGGGAYPDPYGDPNNPYYRQNSYGSQSGMDNMPADNNYGYSERKNTSQSPSGNSNGAYNENSSGMKAAQKMELSKIDESLPQNNASDRELLKMSAKDLDIE